MALNAELLPPERLPESWRHPEAEIDRYALSVDGAIVGSITLAHFSDRAGWAWISMIKVNPAQRGRGYGVLLHELAVPHRRAAAPGRARVLAGRAALRRGTAAPRLDRARCAWRGLRWQGCLGADSADLEEHGDFRLTCLKQGVQYQT